MLPVLEVSKELTIKNPRQIPLPLDGVKVLDFSRVLAGPLCTMLLADLGADVVKVEEPSRGDETRQWGPPWVGSPQDGRSAYFVSVNRNKRSLTLDLQTESGQATAQRLARRCHVVVENFVPGKAEKLGVAFSQLIHINPRLVYCSISGFGQDGPYSDRPGYDYLIQAMSGLMSITGPTEGPASKVGVAISDVIAGLNASTAILAALRQAEQSGQGQHIDIALLDCQIAGLINVASNYLVSGAPPQRHGRQHPNIVPYQTFRASDGEFVAAVGNDRQFAALCQAVLRPELAQDKRFATNPARSQHRKVLIPLLEKIFQQRPLLEWMDLLTEAGVPAGPIHSLPEILDDPHVRSRRLVEEIEGVRMLGSPLRFSEAQTGIRRAPPRLGEHSREVLEEWLAEGRREGEEG